MTRGHVTDTVNWFLFGTPYEAANWLTPLDRLPGWTFGVAAVAMLTFALWPMQKTPKR